VAESVDLSVTQDGDEVEEKEPAAGRQRHTQVSVGEEEGYVAAAREHVIAVLCVNTVQQLWAVGSSHPLFARCTDTPSSRWESTGKMIDHSCVAHLTDAVQKSAAKCDGKEEEAAPQGFLAGAGPVKEAKKACGTGPSCALVLAPTGRGSCINTISVH
jgi:hypothetical protein